MTKLELANNDLANNDLRVLKLMGILDNQKNFMRKHYIKIEADPNFSSNPHMKPVYDACRENSKKYSDEKNRQTEALYNILHYLEALRDNGDITITMQKECDWDINDILKKITDLEKE
jgi:hypothetical protein